MLEKIKGFIGKIGKKGKAMLITAIASLSMLAMTAAASAAEAGETAESTTQTVKIDLVGLMNDAGNTLVTSFGDMIKTMIPIAISIAGGGLVVFGVLALIRLGKKIFGNVTG